MAGEVADQGRRLPIEFHIPPNTVSRYATNFVIQHTKHEFMLSFFEAQPPALLGTPEEQASQLEHMESVRADCVARILVAPGRMKGLICILQRNLATYERTSKWEPEEEGDEDSV